MYIMALKKSSKKMQIPDSDSESDEDDAPIMKTVEKPSKKPPNTKPNMKSASKKLPEPDSDSDSDSEDDKPSMKKTVTKKSKSDSDSDSEDDKSSMKKTVTKKSKPDSDSEDDKPSMKKTVTKKSKSDSDSDEDDKKVKTMNAEKIDDDSEEINNKSESDSESESESENDKKKDKKIKESFDELIKKLDLLQVNIKETDKEIVDLEKSLKVKEKNRNNYERQMNSILKILSKTHNEDIQKRLKEKPKRKGNVNGGFCKEQPVPEILVKFLGLEPGTVMRRPKVMSELCNKFKDLDLKKGQDTILDKATVKALKLDDSYDGKVINMKQFQTFLKIFYTTTDVQQNMVNM